MIPDPVAVKISFIFPGCCNGGVRHLYYADIPAPFGGGMLYPDSPRSAVPLFSEGIDIASEVYQSGLDSMLRKKIRRFVRRMSFCNTTQIYLHSF